MTSSTTSTETARSAVWPERLSLAAVTLIGWALTLNLYHWRFTASVFFLWAGWLSIVVTAKLMWASFWTAASEDDGEEDERLREMDESRRGDLVREKRALLRSIKDVEFDRDMGKMSEAEAGQILRVYRARAIEIIKELDTFAAGDAAGGDAIERELEARLGGGEPRARAVPHPQVALDPTDEDRDSAVFQMLGGVFLAGVGLFITLATYKSAAGGGTYVLWYGPIVSGIALFGRGLMRFGQLKDRARVAKAKAKAKGAGPASEPKAAADNEEKPQ